MKIHALVLASVLLFGCTNEQIYNTVQENQKLECQKYPDTRYQDCMEGLSTSYRDYKREQNEQPISK
jgi:hypothetical protein